MALTFLYRDLDATDTDITSYVVLRFDRNPQGMAENAEERSVGAWDLEIEDDGVLDLHAQRTFYVLEDDTDYADNVLWVGQTFDKHSQRGDIKRTGPDRVYTLSLIDLNTLLERRVIKEGDDPDRPEETDVERMLWLQGLGYIGVTDDWISTADPVDMDAVDYTGRMASEVMEDCMQQSTKNGFMFRDPDTDTFAVFYGDTSADTDVLTSDIRLSNVLSDIDNVTTWEVNLDADQWEANSRIYSGMVGNYDGGAVYVENATTVANFSHRDTTLSWPDVKTASKAIARATRQLAIIGSQEFRITAAVEVPSTSVGLFPHAGWRLEARFSHFPFFTEFTWFRILSRNTTLIGPNRYRIQYELSPGTPVSNLTCSVVAAAATGWEEGEHHNVFNGPPIGFDPLPTIVDYPVMVVGLFAGMNQTEPVWRGNQTASVSGFTEWGDSRDGWTTDAASIALAGYKAVASGTAGTMTATWTGGGTSSGAQSWNAVACAFRTAATAPEHTGWVNGSGDTATLDGPPTVGNLLVICRFTEQGSGFSSAPIGATQVVSGTLVANVNSGYIDIWVRCVQDGDDEDVSTGDNSFAHWAFVSEWALT